jgi:hypothetical protein
MLEEKKLVDKDVAWRNFKISISIIWTKFGQILPLEHGSQKNLER